MGVTKAKIGWRVNGKWFLTKTSRDLHTLDKLYDKLLEHITTETQHHEPPPH